MTERWVDAIVVVLGAALAVGCGSGTPSQPSPGGASTADGGGQPSDSGTPAADGGTSSADGGAGGQPDAGAADAGGGAPGACNGLTPGKPGAASTFATGLLDQSTGCSAGTSDGSGNLLVGTVAHAGSSLWAVPPRGGSGQQLGTLGGAFQYLEQLAGFEGVVQYGHPGPATSVRALGSHGELIKETPVLTESKSAADNPLGGVVVFALATTPGAAGTVTAYDSSANVRWQRPLALPGTFIAIGVDRQGHTLVTYDGSSTLGSGTLGGVWFDADGAEGPFFPVLTGQGTVSAQYGLAPQVGGGLFIQRSSDWVAAIAALATTSSPAPGWLQGRPGTSLHVAHDGQGYVVLPSSASACGQDVEVVSESGESCGTARFVASAFPCGNANQEPLSVSVGYDGSLILGGRTQSICTPAGSDCACQWQWWPAFFR